MSKEEATNKKPLTFARKSALEIPSYSIKAIEDGSVIHVQPLGEIDTRADIDRKTNKQKENKDGTPSEISTLHIVDANGVEGSMVLPFLIHRAFVTASKDGKLSGSNRWFELTKIKSETGKTTHWSVYEVEAS